MKLTDAICLPDPAVISIVGAGGKTSLAFTLARELSEQGKKILVTTTTAMFHPDQLPDSEFCEQKFHGLHIGEARHICDIPPRTGEIRVAALSKAGPKIQGYDPGDLSPVLESFLFDAVIIEADGARMKPVKAPAPHEPVIPSQTRMVIGVMGLDCLGLPLDEKTAHRPERIARATHCQLGDPITPDLLAALAAADQGTFTSAGQNMKKVLVLNKADTSGLADQGLEIVRKIIQKGPGIHACLVTCLKDSQKPVRYVWPNPGQNQDEAR